MKPILSKSITNCHVHGMDSIVFKSNGPMVRVYVAHEDHTLWRNDPRLLKQEKMSIGLHEHRTDITMVPLFGDVFNVFEAGGAGIEVMVYGYEFHSHIRSGQGGFVPRRGLNTALLRLQELTYATFLFGAQAHSVVVPKGYTAAWMIVEGAPSKGYDPVMYSNDPDLASADFSDLYKPMTQERLDLNMELLSKYCSL